MYERSLMHFTIIEAIYREGRALKQYRANFKLKNLME